MNLYNVHMRKAFPRFVINISRMENEDLGRPLMAGD